MPKPKKRAVLTITEPSRMTPAQRVRFMKWLRGLHEYFKFNKFEQPVNFTATLWEEQ